MDIDSLSSNGYKKKKKKRNTCIYDSDDTLNDILMQNNKKSIENNKKTIKNGNPYKYNNMNQNSIISLRTKNNKSNTESIYYKLNYDKTQKIKSYVLTKIENCKNINGKDIKEKFNLTENEIKSIWNNIIIFVNQVTLSNCICAYINVEMQTNGNIDINKFSKMFNYSLKDSKIIIEDWLNVNRIYSNQQKSKE